MNENHTNQQGLTLEEIAVHKQALKIAIAEQQKNVNEAYRQVVAPFSEAKSVSGYIGGRLLNGFTMIESAIWGFRLISRIGSMNILPTARTFMTLMSCRNTYPLFIIENLFCTLYHTKAAQHQQPLSSTTYPIVNPPFRLNYVENLLFIP